MAKGILSVQLDRQSSVLDSLDVAKTTGYDIALPVEISAEDLEKARKDAQMFAELILQ
ncbi:TPA: hypothetical protein KJV97_004426, partial [Shigella flexneri]|nr:hypothetical protein [Shigella flexneri]